MFGSKSREIGRLRGQVSELLLQNASLNKERELVVERSQQAERARVDLAQQVENLREQIQRALDERGRATDQHAIMVDELDKANAKLHDAQEELRLAREEAVQAARAASWKGNGNSLTAEEAARDPHAHGPVRWDAGTELDMDSPEEDSNEKSSAR